MKKTIFIIALVAAGIWGESFAQKNKPKVAYEFPAAMKEEIKTEFIKLCDKGQILYQINCAKCHNSTIKGKEIIPDFTPEQLKGYEIRVSNAQHEANMPEELVTPEELSLISTFLTYKKKTTLEKK